MKIGEIITIIEAFAPLAYQENFDNSGLNIGDASVTCTGYLICFDVTEAILKEAVLKNCNLVISHHPVTLAGLKTFRGTSLAERIIEQALRNRISVYACHTPLDSTPGGINTYLGELFELKDSHCLQPISESKGASNSIGLGIIGNLSHAYNFEQWVARIQEKLHPSVIRHSKFHSSTSEKMIQRVAFCGGSGGSLIAAARNASADIYVSGDIKYHDFVESNDGMILMDLGHFETEHFGIQILYDVLQKKIPTFAGSISEHVINPIHYIV